MRAVTMQDAKLTVAMIADPVPGPGEVLVDVLACGICGTDLHCAAHGPELNAATKGAAGIELMDLSRPIVFGHEFVGRVVSYGPGTEARIPVGRRVVSMPVLPPEQPVLLGFAGPEAPGAYAERIVLSEPLLIEVPDHVSTEVAALIEPLAVAYRTVAGQSWPPTTFRSSWVATTPRRNLRRPSPTWPPASWTRPRCSPAPWDSTASPTPSSGSATPRPTRRFSSTHRAECKASITLQQKQFRSLRPIAYPIGADKDIPTRNYLGCCETNTITWRKSERYCCER